MKLTKKEVKLFRESHSKWLNENSFLAKLFLKKVVNSIKNDPEIKNAIEKADKELEKTRTTIEKISKGNREKVKDAIPLDVRKYLGFDY